MTNRFQDSKSLRRQDIENVVLKETGESLLIKWHNEDAAYLVGYPCDIRGMPTAMQYLRIPKDTIALRLLVREELKPFADDIRFAHRRADHA